MPSIKLSSPDMQSLLALNKVQIRKIESLQKQAQEIQDNYDGFGLMQPQITKLKRNKRLLSSVQQKIKKELRFNNKYKDKGDGNEQW